MSLERKQHFYFFSLNWLTFLNSIINFLMCLYRFGMTAGDQIMGSKEYQDLFQNHPMVAMELSGLYLRLPFP